MKTPRMIYLDHAASSWPKPPEVINAVIDAIEHHGANPGRGSHRMAIDASRILFEARKQLAGLFGIGNPTDISFALNTTEALNLAIKGFLKENDHVICTSVEHNSVRRPLEYVKKVKNVSITYVETNAAGQLNINAFQDAFQRNTRLLVCTHSSNLLGSINPIEELAEICRKKRVRLLVDAAQTGGTFPLDVSKTGIDMLAFPGHKGLLGPQGTGGLYVHPDIDLEPLVHGGTGSQSEAVEQPSVRPDRYEAGTQNVPGIAGLCAGVRYVRQIGTSEIHKHEWELTQALMEGLMGIEGVSVLGPEIGQTRTGIVSFILDKKESSEIAHILDRQFGIAVRAGHHCTPLSHETAGTLYTGAVRASLGYSTSREDIDELLEAVRYINSNEK